MALDLSFLGANRFWAAVAICVLNILKAFGVLGADIVDPLTVFLFTFIGIRTMDRFAEKTGMGKSE